MEQQIEAALNLQVLAFDDFQKWLDDRDPEETDITVLAEMYAKECASGDWVISG